MADLLNSSLRPVFYLILPAILVLAGCHATKHVPEHDYLLVKNTFRIDTKKVSKEDLSGYLQQTPNTKVLWVFRPGITFYNWGASGKDSKFKKWLRTRVGAAPVVLDTSLVSLGMNQMGLYLNNIGYFNSVISDTVVPVGKKKARVFYRIKTTTPYTIRSLHWSVPDTQLAAFIFKDTASCLIKRGGTYNAYTIDKERTRIATALVNHGYYHFTTNYIVMQVDSNLNNRQMNITIEFLNPVVPSLESYGMVKEGKHHRYKIHQIYIYPQSDNTRTDTLPYDTVINTYETQYHGRRSSATYHFLYLSKPKLRTKTIAQNILIEPDTWYNITDVDNTYARLSGLQVFKYVSIEFNDAVKKEEGKSTALPGQLDCDIRMAKGASQSLSWSTDGTNSSGAFGVAGSVGYSNRNIFRGAQLFSIGLSGSAQMQAGGGGGGLFNTFELGVNASLTFPQFLIPIRQERLPKTFKPKTTLSIGYNFQEKQDPKYDRHITNITFGYTWIQNSRLSHTLNPVELLMVKVFPSPEFLEELDQLEDQRIKNQYTDHMITGLKYTLTFSNQHETGRKNFFYLRTNFQTSGNLLYGIDALVKAPKNDKGEYTLFNIQYSQYVRPDVDFRFYNQFKKGFSMAYRFYGGIGIPYGNSDVLPFEKAFIAGGANDMRGWRLGYLGPGTFYNDTLSQNYGQMGDMQLQLQVEYRFPIYSFFKGALFTDIGNIWLLRQSPDLPGGTFYFDTFVSELGIDVGIGLRFDFDFFILRLDPAFPIRVPSAPGNRWYFDKLQLRDIVWNFGIGYPF